MNNTVDADSRIFSGKKVRGVDGEGDVRRFTSAMGVRWYKQN